MKSPFPGMDPYLEHHALWPDVHNRLIAAIADFLGAKVAPAYYVRLESRAYVVRSDDPKDDLFLGRPDLAVVSPTLALPRGEREMVATAVSTPDNVAIVEITLPIVDEVDDYYLEIRDVQTQDLITVIELLSPIEKIDSERREAYLQRRQRIIRSASNYVELDLLRGGEPLPFYPRVQGDYRILVSHGWVRPKARLYLFDLPTKLPDIPLPLLPQDTEPLIPLNQILHETYTRARFDLQIDYQDTAVPPLPSAQEEWAKKLIEEL
jgi:hypothetical protein